MPRQLRKQKAYIVVFCEGESERAYMEFLKKKFSDVAAFKFNCSTNLFEEADSKFKKDKRFSDYTEETDEIWFFFDVETKDISKWDSRLEIIKRLRRLRKRPNIKVRLLMTSGCIEYWLMLHYEMFAPPVQTEAEKKEQALLRKEYIASVRSNLRAQLNNIDVKEADGSIVNLGKKYGNKSAN